VRAFTTSGGTPRWPEIDYIIGNPAFEGVQLLCSQYVGEGDVGFVKAVKCCPFKPSILHNAEYTELVPSIAQASLADGNFSDSDNGFWTTPFGWEGYADDGEQAAAWTWQIQFVSGRLETIRNAANIPPFSFFDPTSWLLAPNVPVPASAYESGIPGFSPPGWGPQRMQWFGEESGQVHLVVPSNTTVCLFARWAQETHNVTSARASGSSPATRSRASASRADTTPRMGGTHERNQNRV
jgi:hypothetical protein